MKANGHKLKIRKYHLKIRRKFLIVRVVKPKSKLPKQMVDPPSLEALKTWLNVALRKLLQLTLLGADVCTR